MTESRAARIAILISGRGSNACALMDAAAGGAIAGRVSRVISSREDAPGLGEARRRGIAAEVVAAREFNSRADYGEALAARLDGADLVALAGFMQVLDAAFIRRFAGRVLNIHPSLLPAYKGLDTHRRVIEAGETRHGCSVHFVTEELDAGPLIMQAEVAVAPGDTPAALAARVLREEHRIYPRAVALVCDGRIEMRDGRCLLDGRVLQQPLTPDAPL
ncbi:MAG: phosphoribosylglycinamide formyltransferase [Gammaproteobacteria bacterium]|nr:phosphoribosylglycinamide formyltransferase [Gammaproteobacteria bacterium]